LFGGAPPCDAVGTPGGIIIPLGIRGGLLGGIPLGPLGAWMALPIAVSAALPYGVGGGPPAAP